MVHPLIKTRATHWTWTGSRFTRQKPSSKQTAALNPLLLLIRARYYDPATGEFISRDPLEYVDGMSQYRAYFVPGGTDPTGQCLLPPQKDFCGPDATRAFVAAVARSRPTLRTLPWFDRYIFKDPISWGTSIDFTFAGKKGAKYAGCSTGKCEKSIFFCGKCMHTHVLNNILYGIVAAANGVPVGVMNIGGHTHNVFTGRGFEGTEQQSAYWVGWNIWATIVSKPVHINEANICYRVRQHNQINNFVGFDKCQPCGKKANIKDFKFSIGDKLRKY